MLTRAISNAVCCCRLPALKVAQIPATPTMAAAPDPATGATHVKDIPVILLATEDVGRERRAEVFGLSGDEGHAIRPRDGPRAPIDGANRKCPELLTETAH